VHLSRPDELPGDADDLERLITLASDVAAALEARSRMTVPAASSVPARLLLGPGPSPVHPEVLAAQARPVVGHLDPWFLALADEIAAMLRTVFRTANRLTFPVSGTGSAGMEAAIVNVVSPGDTVIVGVNGVFGGRLADTARRAGAEVVELVEDWGRIVPPERVEEALGSHPEARAVVLVHAETSTGAHQPLAEVGAMLRDTETLSWSTR
jgi:alanine-glyoxylate transaminase / serine-glyoxylate transaminase / serine-pyruvate transaminase